MRTEPSDCCSAVEEPAVGSSIGLALSVAVWLWCGLYDLA